MATAENAKLNIEAGQTFFPIEQMTDSGDRTIYNIATGETQFSAAEGTSISVRLDGLTTGGVPVPTAVNDQIAISAGSYNLGGSVLAVVANISLTVTRAVATDTHQITSVVIDTDGIYEPLAGTDGTAFSETRGADGGPPFIPVGFIEICQVRLSSNVAGIIESTEIFQVNGQHVERSTSPLFVVNNSTGDVTFISALPAIHTGSLARDVFIEYSTPIFSEIADASDFVPPEQSDSSTSTQVYGRTVSATSTTLNQGTFTALLENGVSDLVIQQKGQTLWFEFFPNRFATSNKILQQGKLGVTRTFPADDLIAAACTITAQEQATEESA